MTLSTILNSGITAAVVGAIVGGLVGFFLQTRQPQRPRNSAIAWPLLPSSRN
jgi:hypothetical protein